MSDAELALLRAASATGIDVAVLRAVWLREAMTASGVEACVTRVTEFTLRGPHSQDSDLWPPAAKTITAAAQLLLWSEVATAADGGSLTELGVRVRCDQFTGEIVKTTPELLAVLTADGLRFIHPSKVTRIN